MAFEESLYLGKVKGYELYSELPALLNVCRLPSLERFLVRYL